MPEADEHLGGLPDTVRNSNRPIIIYQGAPPGLDAQTYNALGLLSWLALVTLCLAAIVFCTWQVWNPGYDQRQFSPVYAEGRPLGLAGQIEERRHVNERAEGLIAFLDRVRAERASGSSSSAASHPLISDRDGIDDLRRRWDELCLNIRARIYDRRVGQIDAELSALQLRLQQARDAAERTRLNGELRNLQQLRREQIERRRTDGDSTLRCVPAEQAPVCSATSNDEWCNPELKRPGDFLDEVG